MGSKKVVLKTLLYSDIFDYPLTKEEIWNYLISDKKILKKDFLLKLKNEKTVEQKDGFYFIKNRENIIEIRKKRQKISIEKIKKAKKIIPLLSLFPTVRMIGISGSLALENCEEDEDIDLFVITETGSLWVTRFLLVVSLKLFGLYREKKSKIVKDKFCLNMLISKNCLKLSKSRQNLFSAHEIAQVLPIVSKGSSYRDFIAENLWVKNYLPNFKIRKSFIEKKEKNLTLIKILKIFNSILFRLQFEIMKRNITKEEVGIELAAFHPEDQSIRTIKEYKKRLKKYAKI
ncbi:hypothetical protein M1349_02205 [Patescibacteria group bacterium]|nr:hypothetical protein [Patescibacteria group bacterium]